MTHVDATVSFDVLALGGPDQWRIDPELASGGALMDAGVYTATAARFVADGDPVTVTGTTVSKGDAFEGVDERTTYDVPFDGGATASCAASFAGGYDDRVRVRGTRGPSTSSRRSGSTRPAS